MSTRRDRHPAAGCPPHRTPDTNGVTGPAYVSSGAVLSGTAKGARGTALPRSGSPGVESKSGLGTEACLPATGHRCWLGSARVGSARLGSARVSLPAANTAILVS